jgi:hypothetical protein
MCLLVHDRIRWEHAPIFNTCRVWLRYALFRGRFCDVD